MRKFAIIPVDKTAGSIELSAIDERALLTLVSQLECREAAVLEGGHCKLSLHVDEHQVWHIFPIAGERAQVRTAPSKPG